MTVLHSLLFTLYSLVALLPDVVQKLWGLCNTLRVETLFAQAGAIEAAVNLAWQRADA